MTLRDGWNWEFGSYKKAIPYRPQSKLFQRVVGGTNVPLGYNTPLRKPYI